MTDFQLAKLSFEMNLSKEMTPRVSTETQMRDNELSGADIKHSDKTEDAKLNTVLINDNDPVLFSVRVRRQLEQALKPLPNGDVLSLVGELHPLPLGGDTAGDVRAPTLEALEADRLSAERIFPWTSAHHLLPSPELTGVSGHLEIASSAAEKQLRLIELKLSSRDNVVSNRPRCQRSSITPRCLDAARLVLTNAVTNPKRSELVTSSLCREESAMNHSSGRLNGLTGHLIGRDPVASDQTVTTVLSTAPRRAESSIVMSLSGHNSPCTGTGPGSRVPMRFHLDLISLGRIRQPACSGRQWRQDWKWPVQATKAVPVKERRVFVLISPGRVDIKPRAQAEVKGAAVQIMTTRESNLFLLEHPKVVTKETT